MAVAIAALYAIVTWWSTQAYLHTYWQAVIL